MELTRGTDQSNAVSTINARIQASRAFLDGRRTLMSVGIISTGEYEGVDSVSIAKQRSVVD
jgi:hypothetical protein